MSGIRAVWVVLAVSFIPAVAAQAQWVNVAPPGVPKTSNGQPDLKAPVSRTVDGRVDLSGVWTAVADRRDVPPAAQDIPRNRHAANIGVDTPGGAPMTAWAIGIRAARQANDRRDLSTSRCLPSGIPPDMLRPTLLFKIVQATGITAILLEEFNNWRQILTDGRPLPSISNPGSFGYSIGTWDSDTFVVKTVGLSEQTWLDSGGTPHSEDLRLTERFNRRDFGHMDIEYTFDDPKAFTKIWSTRVGFELHPELELMDHQCEVNRAAGAR